MNDEPQVRFHGVNLSYGSRVVLRDIDFSIHEGESLVLAGPNGSGKTTLLKSLTGSLTPSQGQIHWKSGQPARIGYVPQREQLDTLWPLTVGELVMMGRYARTGPMHRTNDGDRETLQKNLKETGIEDLKHRPIAELSGGQIQRAMLARALMCEPELLLLDEPTNQLDMDGTLKLIHLLDELRNQRNLTVVSVFHDLNQVSTLAQRVALLHDGTVSVGLVDEILEPATLRSLYGVNVVVDDINGRKVVIPVETTEAGKT